MALRDRRGFTLVELMIVVAIIGILAAIAIPNFLQFRLKAKASEAKANLGAIRSTEIAYFAESNRYVSDQPWTPTANRSGDPSKRPWVVTTRFSILGFAPEGNVFYSYMINPSGNLPLYDTAGFTVLAVGDLDGDGTTAGFFSDSGDTELRKMGGTSL